MRRLLGVAVDVARWAFYVGLLAAAALYIHDIPGVRL